MQTETNARPSQSASWWWGGSLPDENMRVRRQATSLFNDRHDARAHIARSSPTLQHTESWLETLTSCREYVPTPLFYFIVLVATAETALDNYVGHLNDGTTSPHLYELPESAHNTMLGLLSLLLAFRTSQAYSRWWEARTLWGAIVNSTRNIASNAACWMEDLDRQREVIKLTICFAWVTKASLRGVRPSEMEVGGLLRDELFDLAVAPYVGPPRREPPAVKQHSGTIGVGAISFKEPKEMMRSPPLCDETRYLYDTTPVEHLPMLMVDEIRLAIQIEMDEQAEGSARQRVTGSWDILMGQDIKALVDALGGCERIQKTPMPFGYLAQQRIFMLTWLLTYPLCLVGDYGWWTIPMMFFIAFIMLKVDAIGVEIEHPFGAHKHDLPLESICITIEKNLLEILRRAETRHLRAHERQTRPRHTFPGGEASPSAAQLEISNVRVPPL